MKDPKILYKNFYFYILSRFKIYLYTNNWKKFEKNNTIYKDVHSFYMIRFLISCY